MAACLVIIIVAGLLTDVMSSRMALFLTSSSSVAVVVTTSLFTSVTSSSEIIIVTHILLAIVSLVGIITPCIMTIIPFRTTSLITTGFITLVILGWLRHTIRSEFTRHQLCLLITEIITFRWCSVYIPTFLIIWISSLW